MIRESILFLFLAVALTCIAGTHTSYATTSLKVAPDSYKARLKSGERQKGFIDVSNPTEETLQVNTAVQAFRQVDDKGSLEFYDDAQVTKGVQLDLTKFELRPHEVLRMYFILDGKKLPSGDVFAAIFFKVSQPSATNSAVQQAVRVGTLFSVVNGTPGPRDAEILHLDVPFFQTGTAVEGSVTVQNTADSDKNTGFYPELATSVWPGKQKRLITSALVFAGRTRTTDFELKNIGLGIHKVTVSYKGSSKTAWSINVDPFTLIIVGAIIGTVGLETALWLRRRSRLKQTRQ